ncbi:MAG TPA: hypothetical protein VEI97_10680, partial [bacterium]|nr:hypothetical protein [bacterium]
QLTADGAGVAIEALPARAAQTPDQGRLFHLDIGQFMRPRDLEIRAFRYNGDGNLQVDYAVHHPFPAPDLTQPPGGKNRSDLGFTGQLLILADVPAAQVASHTYFPGVVANTEAVVDADGYVNPGDLLFRDTAQWATAFPYKLVVDEARDNREGVGNDGRPTGNYDPTRGGWQAFNIDEFGVKNGWTGYDFLHQGQTVRGSFTLDRRILAQPGGFRVQLAVLIKYQDPKGTVPSVDPYVRFPQTDPVDIHKFCYRVPFGALDASKVDLAPAEGFLSTGVGTMATLDVKVRDWDATAPIAANNPGDDPNLNSVQFGADGRPAVDAGIPTLGDSPFPSLPLVGGNGEPGAELRYRVYVTNNKGNAPAGTVTGLIRATDPEQSVNGRELYTFGIDPNTLAPDPARRLDAITYQRVTLALPAHQGYADSLP